MFGLAPDRLENGWKVKKIVGTNGKAQEFTAFILEVDEGTRYLVMESLESREIVGDQSVLVGSHCSTLPDAGRLAEELIDMKIKEATA